MFLLQEERPRLKELPQVLGLVSEKRTVGHEQSANAIEEDGWIFALDHEHEELCELIMIDSGASVHVCPPDHGQENGRHRERE